LKGGFLLLCLLGLALPGCSRHEPPALDALHSQLLRDACDALLAGDAKRSLQALERLDDASQGDSFAAAAQERVRHHARLLEINDAVREGRIDEASRLVNPATAPGFKAAAQAGPAVDALVALKQYLDKRPFATSDEGEVALRALNPHRALLETSPAFQQFVQQQTAELAALRRREEIAVVDWLVAELDDAAVSAAPHASERLAHLAALRPEHDLLKTWRAATASDLRALNRLSALTAGEPASRRAFEVGICLAWNQMNASAWQAVAPPLALGPPASLSGQLLAAAAAAEAGQYDAAVRNLHAVASQTTLDRTHVARLLRHYVLSPGQAEAWCWRTPCPGVADVLGCIIQLRTSSPR
jgi:hypothetical protein